MYEYHVEEVEPAGLKDTLCTLGAQGYRLVWVMPVDGATVIRLILERTKTA